MHLLCVDRLKNMERVHVQPESKTIPVTVNQVGHISDYSVYGI